MNDQTEVAASEPQKTVIRPDLNRYVRAKSGSGKRTHRTDDFIARTLAGKDLEAIKRGANLLGIDVGKWEKLNPGQQRMLIGNALRHRLVDTKAPLSEQAVTDVYGEPVAPYDAEAAAAADAAAKAAKEAKAAEKAAAKAAKAAPAGPAEAAGEEAPATEKPSRKKK